MGRDMSKKKASSSTARSESSAEGEAGRVDEFLNKCKNVATSLFSQRHESRVFENKGGGIGTRRCEASEASGIGVAKAYMRK
nr:hypothetical protein [Tanacetum cinerariifolium]